MSINRTLGCCGGRDAHSSHKEFVALVEVEVVVRVKSFPSLFPSQSNDVMVEYIKREALSEVFLEL